MTEKTNLFPNLIRFRETNRLKMAIAASIMLWCATPQQAAADTLRKTRNRLRTAAESENNRYGTGPERRSHDRRIRQSERQCHYGYHH